MDKLKSVDHFLYNRKCATGSLQQEVQEVCNRKCATGSVQTNAALQGGVHPKVEMAKTSVCRSLSVQHKVSKQMSDIQKEKT